MRRIPLLLILLLALESAPAFAATVADPETVKTLNDQVRGDIRLQVQAPVVRGVFSLGLPGTGQWFNGEEAKFRTHLGVGLGLPVLTLGSFTALQLRAISMAQTGNVYELEQARGMAGTLGMVGLLLSVGWHVYSAYDAYAQANAKLQEGAFPIGTPTGSSGP